MEGEVTSDPIDHSFSIPIDMEICHFKVVCHPEYAPKGKELFPHVRARPVILADAVILIMTKVNPHTTPTLVLLLCPIEIALRNGDFMRTKTNKEITNHLRQQGDRVDPLKNSQI